MSRLAVRTLESLLATEEPMLILALLAREVRTGWTIQEWSRRGQGVEQIARTLRRPVAVVQAYAAISAQGARGAPAALRRCWEAERRLKSGGDARAELTTLVVALCGRLIRGLGRGALLVLLAWPASAFWPWRRQRGAVP